MVYVYNLRVTYTLYWYISSDNVSYKNMHNTSTEDRLVIFISEYTIK